MKGILIATIFFFARETCAAQEFEAEAPAAPGVKIVVTGSSSDHGTICTLSRVAGQAKPRELWGIRSEDSNPMNWFNLISAEEKGGELAVLAESAMDELRLLRFRLSDGEKLGDTRVRASGLLLRQLNEKGLLQVKLPNRIEWKNGAGLLRIFVLEGDRLRGEGDGGFDPSTPGGGYPDDPGQKAGKIANRKVQSGMYPAASDGDSSAGHVPEAYQRGPKEGAGTGP